MDSWWGFFCCCPMLWSCSCHLGWWQVHVGGAEQHRLLWEKGLSGKDPKEGKRDQGKRCGGERSPPALLPQAAPAPREAQTLRDPRSGLPHPSRVRRFLRAAGHLAGELTVRPQARGASMPAPPLAAPLLRALLARLLPLARKRLLPPLRRLGRRLRSRESRQALLTCLLCLLNLRKKVDD